jgi:hypothetical protein
MKYHVKRGNTKKDIEKPKNLGPHNSSIALNANVVPQIKLKPAGKPKMIAGVITLPSHHCQTN